MANTTALTPDQQRDNLQIRLAAANVLLSFRIKTATALLPGETAFLQAVLAQFLAYQSAYMPNAETFTP